jgi:hypothetical protein
MPSTGAPDQAPDNIPRQLTSFIGRERELQELKRLLERSRLLTLTGPGGSGKTRLCLQLGAEVVVWVHGLATFAWDAARAARSAHARTADQARRPPGAHWPSAGCLHHGCGGYRL